MTSMAGWGRRRILLFAAGSLLAGLGAGLVVAGMAPMAVSMLLLAGGAVGTAWLLPSPGRDAGDRPAAAPRGGERDDPVTVVVCARDEARFLGPCLDSVLGQRHRTLQVVVVDDGSTDRTLDVALAAAGGDDRVAVLSNDTPLGLAAARNQGLAAATGRWVTFLDGDDLLFPESISARLAAADAHRRRDPWSAGSYCDWIPVPEGYRLDDPPPSRRLDDVEWLNTLDDVPFVASAPLLQTSVVRAVGGFPEEVSTAEDALLWPRLLRSGFTVGFAPGVVGVAYRQKAASMYRETAVDHAEIVAGVVEANHEPMSWPAPSGAPHPYPRPAGHYLAGMTRFRRLVAAHALAIASGDDAAVASARAALGAAAGAHLRTALVIEDVVGLAAWRVAATGAMTATDEAILRDRLAEDVEAALPPRRPYDLTAPISAAPVVGRSAAPVRRSPSVGTEANDVVVVPTAAYHADEAGPMVEALSDRGLRAGIAVPEKFAATVLPALARWVDRATMVDPERPELRCRALVVFDDWGTETRPLVEFAAARDVVTVAKVEGVQDFADDDVPRDRSAYRTAAVVLGQGRNDVAALAGCDVRIVGSSRLERIWRQPFFGRRRPLAVLNVNFTWGVLEEARELWVETAAAGCAAAGIPFVLSLHPSEQDRYRDRFPVAEEPMRHLLTRATILVSRFSTVPFEAMARGVPFVYHNPHGEKVPTFKHAGGAFETSDDPASLTAAMARSGDPGEGYRERAAAFFSRQIDIDPSRPSEERAAEVVVSLLGN